MTAQPHIIRLRDPWQWAAGGAGHDGVNVLQASRWFNRPTGLVSSTRIVLVVAGISELRSARLNNQALSGQQKSSGLWESEIGEHLELRNQLQLEFHTPGSASADDHLHELLAAGNARLEIYA